MFSISVIKLLLIIFVQFGNISSSSSVDSTINHIDSVSISLPQCPDQQRSALLQFKHGFSIRRAHASTWNQLDSWKPHTDCCSWNGIKCDAVTGQVINLNLGGSDESWIIGRIGSSLFSLGSLERLNLSYNFFDDQPIPFELGLLPSLTHLDLSWSGFIGQVPLELATLRRLVYLNLAGNHLDVQLIPSWLGMLSDLTHLDLSNSNFEGQVPLELSKLTNLISLDLSSRFLTEDTKLKLGNPNLAILVQNLSSLRRLFLDGVDMSTVEPSSRGNGDLHWAHSLQNMSSLRSLGLSNCGLWGEFPKSLFLIPSLTSLDISDNPNLTVVFPEFPQTTALQILRLGNTSFPARLPSSFANLTSLKVLSLQNCNLSSTFSSLMPTNNFSRIETLDLSSNFLTGSIPSSFGYEFEALTKLYLYDNFLEGIVPPSLFSILSLETLGLDHNQLSGLPDHDHDNVSASVLTNIYLNDNKLQGLLPKSFFHLKNVKALYLRDNNFSDSVELGMFLNLQNLIDLDIGNSGLSIINGSNTLSSKHLAKIESLYLQSCNMMEFPILLQNLSRLSHLDLADNKIQGQIPNWIWEVGNGNLYFLNLSNNLLECFQQPLPSYIRIEYVDLHSNVLKGSLPNFTTSISFQDYSNNKFKSTIPPSMDFTSAWFFSISNNSLSGEIPLSICEAPYLQVLDLSTNNFTGNIPTCLIENLKNSLQVLNLQKNSFQGSLPQTFKDGCSLETFNVRENRLEGKLPNSLVNCKKLKVLDVGNNQINDTFPFWLENISTLHVLILKSNKFHGPIVHSQKDSLYFPSLQIFDLSSNYFTRSLPEQFFSKWKAMIKSDGSQSISNNQIIKHQIAITGLYYQDTVTITSKGLVTEYVKILNALVVVDLSSNRFQGEIPKLMGNLKLIYELNLSHNDFLGTIPYCFGNLTQLESLDLSQNKLLGIIPLQLTKLTFLAFLNLSENLLTGEIPRSQQSLTFTNDSFLGNIGLCGLPLSKECEVPTNTSNNFEMKGEATIDRKAMSIGFGIGYGVGLGAILWTLVLWEKGSRKYLQLIDRAFNCNLFCNIHAF